MANLSKALILDSMIERLLGLGPTNKLITMTGNDEFQSLTNLI